MYGKMLFGSIMSLVVFRIIPEIIAGEASVSLSSYLHYVNVHKL